MAKAEIVTQGIIAFGSLVAIATLAYQVMRDATGKRWEQANRITTWIETDNRVYYSGWEYSETVIISNGSCHPIYDVVLFIGFVDSMVKNKPESYCRSCFVIPPGEWVTKIEWLYENDNIYNNFNAVIMFRDVNGKYWKREADGILEKSSYEIHKKVMDSAILSISIHRHT